MELATQRTRLAENAKKNNPTGFFLGLVQKSHKNSSWVKMKSIKSRILGCLGSDIFVNTQTYSGVLSKWFG